MEGGTGSWKAQMETFSPAWTSELLGLRRLFDWLINPNVHLYAGGSQITTRATFDPGEVWFKCIFLHLKTATLSHRDVRRVLQATSNIITAQKRSCGRRVTRETRNDRTPLIMILLLLSLSNDQSHLNSPVKRVRIKSAPIFPNVSINWGHRQRQSAHARRLHPWRRKMRRALLHPIKYE